MGAAKIDSPRGAFTLGKNHDPVQDIYLRQRRGQGEQGHRCRRQVVGRPRPRLHDVTLRFAPGAARPGIMSGCPARLRSAARISNGQGS